MHQSHFKKKLIWKSIDATMIMVALWFMITVTAIVVMATYANSPGDPEASPAQWPVESSIPRVQNNPTLIMFAHPKCPCTRASLGELEVLLSNCQGKVSAHISFVQPKGMTIDWVKTDLWNWAARIPGLITHIDRDGVEARRFGSRTSGCTVLYDTDGHLLFQGGITMSRGHSGDNLGRSTIEALLNNENVELTKTPAYGCALFDIECEIGDTACKK